MKSIQRVLAALLTMTLLLSSIPLSTFAEPAYTENPVQSESFSTIAEDLQVFQQSESDAPVLQIVPAEDAHPDSSEEVTADISNELLAGVPDTDIADETPAPQEDIADDETVAQTPEATEEPFEEVPVEPTAEATEEPIEEVPAKPTAEATQEPTRAPQAAPTKKPVDKHAGKFSSQNTKIQKTAGNVVIQTAYDLAEYFDISLSELADWLEIDQDTLLAMPAEELQQLAKRSAHSSGSNAYKISLGKQFTNTAFSTSSTNYEISISRTGRYRLSLYGSKYLAVNVYNGKNIVTGLGHACNGSTINWTIDLEKGNTYTFEFFVDGRYSSGYCTFNAELSLYVDGSYKERATALTFGVFTPYNIQYGNDTQIFCFTALTGRQYRVSSTGSVVRSIELYDSNFKPINNMLVKNISGSKYFDMQVVAGKTYYILVHGRNYFSSNEWWNTTGSGTLKIDCLDADTSPVTFSMNKTNVDPGLASSVKFTVASEYASKVRLMVNGVVTGKEHKVSGGKVEFSQSFHVSGTQSVQIQGYTNGSWSLMSRSQTLTVNSASSLGKPEFESISNNADTTYANSDYLLRWRSLSGASQYLVKVYSGNENIHTINNISGTSCTIPGEVFGTAGVYTIELYGLAQRGQQSNPCARATLTVEPAIQTAKPTKVELSESGTVVLGLNETLQLTASLQPSNAIRNLTWSSSNKKVATVDAAGLVVPVKEGTVTITVKTHNGKKDKVKVKIVDPNKPTGVELTVSGTVDLRMDRTMQLYANMKPASATRSLTWSSSNKKIATVDANGLVTPLKAGTVTITVKTHNGKKDTVKIKIQEYYRLQSLQLLYNGNDCGEIYVGDTVTLTTKYTPAKAKTFANLTWKSDKPSIVSVSSDGKLTALNSGYAVVTATDRESGVSASFGVVVTRQPRYRAIVVVENTFTTGSRRMSYSRSSDRNGIKKMLSQQNFNGRKVEQIADLSNQSKSSLMSNLRSLPRQWDIHEDDVTYFFFGGHGSNNGYLCLYSGGAENQFISASELKSVLDGIPGKVVVIIGSCYSGYFIHDGSGTYSADTPDPKEFTSSIIDVFSEGDTLPIVALDESGEEIPISEEDKETWENMGIGANRGELRQSKYYVLTAAAHNQQGWFYYWYRNNSIIESKSFGCFERAVCYAGGRDSVGGKTTWKSGTRTLSQVYNTVQSKVDGYQKKYGRPPKVQSVQVYPKNSNFIIFSK